MPQLKMESTVDHVRGLIRPDLQFDPSDERRRPVRGLGFIVCTYGARIETAVDLARHGRFIGGDEYGGVFHATPNRAYKYWDRAGLDSEDLEIVKRSSTDAVGAAIAYSEMSKSRSCSLVGLQEDEDAGADSYVPTEDGIVLLFNSKVLGPGMRVDLDLDTKMPELMLPEAPSLDSVHSIYPLDKVAYDSLLLALRHC